MNEQERHMVLDGPASDPDQAEHVDTYLKFVRCAKIAAAMTPVFMAFVLYWTY